MEMLTFILIALVVTDIHADTHINGHCTKDDCKAPSFLGRFNIPTKPLPRVSINDPLIKQRLENQLPTVITDSNIYSSDNNIDLDYMHSILKKSKTLWHVFTGDTRKFLYYQYNSNYANYKWTPPHKVESMTYTDFSTLLDKVSKTGGQKRIYLQSPITPDTFDASEFRVNSSAVLFFKAFIEPHPTFYKRGALLFVGMRDVLTPLHFDISNNIFVQVYGRKRCILIGPEHYSNLYPYPTHHPHDRQSMVDAENPDYKRFPKFKDVSGYETVLNPGDVLYIPSVWWHLIETERNSESVSISFKFEPSDFPFILTYTPEMANRITSPNGSVSYFSSEAWRDKQDLENGFFSGTGSPYFKRPDTPVRQVHIMRHIEQMIAESRGNYRDVGHVLKEMMEGRFDDLEFNET